MPEPTGVARSPSRQERRYRRFKLRYPVHLLFRSGELVSEVDAVSRDVSIGGLLVESPVPIPMRTAVNFIISLRARTSRPVDLTGEGKVVRVEPSGPQAEFAVALECKKPITQIEPYLPNDLN
jgi:PilZ domain